MYLLVTELPLLTSFTSAPRAVRVLVLQQTYLVIGGYQLLIDIYLIGVTIPLSQVIDADCEEMTPSAALEVAA